MEDEKEGDVLVCRWYVKWWDKFSHTQEIINLVSREFPIQNALPLAKIQTPAQIAEPAITPASSSAKSDKTIVKSKSKGSPLDEIKKDPGALYALLKVAQEKEKAAEENDSEEERSTGAFVASNPYYPYNQEFFEHDEEFPDLADD